MAKIAAFEKYATEYEAWFERNRLVFESELQAIKEQLPESGECCEVGVGSGRFAAPLGIRHGVDPSPKMRKLAQSRGIEAIDGIAEQLPYDDHRFNVILMITTICFIDNLEMAFREAYRVLKPAGHLIVGFIDKDSPVGEMYRQRKKESKFYQAATFYTANEVIMYLERAGFKNLRFMQTIFQPTEEISGLEPVKKGYGKGSFVVVKASKKGSG